MVLMILMIPVLLRSRFGLHSLSSCCVHDAFLPSMGLLLLHYDCLSGTGQSSETSTPHKHTQTNNFGDLSSKCAQNHFNFVCLVLLWKDWSYFFVSFLISLCVWRAWSQPWWTCILPPSGVRTAGSSSSWQWLWSLSSWGSSC